jgi:hypothetical protein
MGNAGQRILSCTGGERLSTFRVPTKRRSCSASSSLARAQAESSGICLVRLHANLKHQSADSLYPLLSVRVELAVAVRCQVFIIRELLSARTLYFLWALKW